MTAARVGLEGVAYLASVTSSEETGADFTLIEIRLQARYALSPAVDVEVGYLRRTIDPEFAAQDVGAFSVGARLHSALASIATMYVRGAFTPIADFNGGGSAGLSYQVGLGFDVGPETARWRIRADYDFQRFGRSVRGTDVPIQLEAARVGVAYRLF